MIIESIVAVVATFGFGIIFNIGRKNLLFASLGGGLSWFIYKLCLNNGFSLYAAFFTSAVIFSIYSEICARTFKSPVTTFVICALIPLVPGSGMYYTMYEVIKGNISTSVTMMISTIASAGCLALGVIFVSTITRLINSVKSKKSRKRTGLPN